MGIIGSRLTGRSPANPLPLVLSGYSHGGGTLYKLTELLDAELSFAGKFAIKSTSYVDAIQLPEYHNGSIFPFAETRKPITTPSHFNQYISFGFIHGAATEGVPQSSQIDYDRNDIQFDSAYHSRMHRHPPVLNELSAFILRTVI